MDITGHFESASCVIEVDGSDTLAQVKGKLLAELGVPHARHVGVRMKGGGDIGNDDLRICDTEMDEGCAVELYRIGAVVTPGVIEYSDNTHSLTLSPCDRYLAVMGRVQKISIFDTETRKLLCRFPAQEISSPSFSPCSEWIASVNGVTQCAEIHDVKTGALEHSFGDDYDETNTTAWSPCGTKLLSCSSKGLQVWDIATGVVVHAWGHIVECLKTMVVSGDRMVRTSGRCITVWDYTTGAQVFVLICPSSVEYVALTPNQQFIAACGSKYVRVWNIETGECVFQDSLNYHWTHVAVSNDIVAAYAYDTLCLWSISTGGRLLLPRDLPSGFVRNNPVGLAISSCGGAVIHGAPKGAEIVGISQLS